mgnify:CR=1 FL=1
MSINKVILIGNVGKDPELRYNPSGVAWCTLSLATTRKWKDRDSGEQREETEWHRLVFNDRLAEVVGEYIEKGSKIYVEGRLKTRKYEDKDTGKDVYVTEIMADQMQMLGERRHGDDNDGRAQRETHRPPRDPDRQQGRQQQRPQQRQPQRTSRQDSNTGFSDMDDDIPL